MVRLVALALASFLVTSCRLAPAPQSGAAPEAGLQVRLVKIEHCSAAESAPIVQGMIEIWERGGDRIMVATSGAADAPPAHTPQQVAIAHTATNTLVLLGTEAELRGMLDLVARLDAPPSEVHER